MKSILIVTLIFASILSAQEKTVRDFGAVGDGKFDDTAAIQKAVENNQK